MLTRRTLAGAAVATCLTAEARADTLRVASLNPCLDAILVHVADRAQIAALSHFAREPQTSTIADIARTLPFTYESAEEIIAVHPNLVLASGHSGLATQQALARLNIEVATFGVPNTIDESLAQIEGISARIDRAERGRALVARIRDAIADAQRSAARPPIKALVFQPRGLVAGEGTLTNELMNRVGFDNVAARYGIRQWGNVPLELLLEDPPELLLSGSVSPGAPIWAERIVSHPALARIAPLMRRAEFPQACLYCGGPVLLQTTHALVNARTAFWSAS